MSRKRLIILIFSFTSLVLAVYLGASVVLYNQLATVEPHCDGQFNNNTPAHFTAEPFNSTLDTTPYLMPEYESVNIAARDPGITLSGWYVPGNPENHAAILVVHGLGVGTADCKSSPRALLPAGMLHRAGFNVLLIDLRDHGDSTIEDGKWSGGTEEYGDVLSAWDWLQTEKQLNPVQIGIMAYSGGTGTTLIAMGQEQRIAAAWLDSVFVDIHQSISDRLRMKGYPTLLEPGGILMARLLSSDNLEAFRPLDAAINGRPIYLVHGDADQVLPLNYADQLIERLKLPADRIWIVPGADHVRAVFMFPEVYEQRLIAFFKSVLLLE